MPMAYPWITAVTDAITRLASYYNGNAYNALSNPGGYDNDGHRINFVPTLQDMALVGTAIADAADYANTKATAAASSETNAALSAAKLQGTSTTTRTPALGSVSFVTQSGKFFSNADLKVYSAGTPTIFMIGTATAYSGTALTINVDTIGTASSASDWVIIVTGRTGATGSTGSTGSAGSTGATGKAAGLAYAWNTSTASSDPGSGQIKANNATLSSATALYISETDADSNAISAVLATWDDGTSTNKVKVHLYNPAAPTNWWEFYITGTLTDNGSWDTFTITHISSGGSFTNGVALAALVIPIGDKGDTGATGSTGSTGATGPVVAEKWTYIASMTDADPGSGNFKLAATSPDSPASVTFIYLDNLDALGNTVTSLLDSWDDSTNTTDRGRLTLTDVTTPSIVLNFKITGAVIDGTGYRKVPVTWLSGTSFPTVSGAVAFNFAPTGNKGADGSGSGTVVGPVSAVDTNIATWNGTSGALLSDGGSKISDLQPKDATLTALAALSTANNQIILETGTDTFSNISFTVGAQALGALTYAADKIGYTTSASAASTTDLTTQGRQLLDDTSFSAMRTTLGLAIGTDVEAWSAKLDALAALTWAADKAPYFTSASVVATYDLSSFARTILDDADAATVRTTISAQQQDATLDALAAVTTASNKLIYATGSDAFTTTDFSAYARTLVDDADAATARTTLGLATVASSGSAADLSTGTLPDARLSTAALPYGRESIWAPAGGMIGATTNGAATGTVETSASGPVFATLDFDTSTQESAHFNLKMPDQWNRSTVTFRAVWSHAALVTSPDLTGVVWAISGVAISDAESTNATFGTEVTVSDTTSAPGTANVQYVTAESTAVTIQGQPSPDVITTGDVVYFRVRRVPANAADTITGDAKLIGVEIYVTTTKATDA